VIKHFEKFNIDAVEFAADKWDRVENPDGSATYTANADNATATVKFRPTRGDQEHIGMKAGSKVTARANGSAHIEHVT